VSDARLPRTMYRLCGPMPSAQVFRFSYLLIVALTVEIKIASHAAQTPANRKSSMTWLFETSARAAAFWFNASQVALLTGALLVLVGTYGAFRSSAAKDKFTNERISGNERVTAGALAEVARANEGAARANEGLARAQANIAEANARAAEADERTAQLRLELEHLTEHAIEDSGWNEPEPEPKKSK